MLYDHMHFHTCPYTDSYIHMHMVRCTSGRNMYFEEKYDSTRVVFNILSEQ